MLQEHKDVLRKNLVQLVRNLNPEPVIYRLSQLGILTQCNVENILANPTRHAKSSVKRPCCISEFLSCTKLYWTATSENIKLIQMETSGQLVIDYLLNMKVDRACSRKKVKECWQ